MGTVLSKEKYVYVKLGKNLGDQLFQIAAGYSYSRDCNLSLYLDKSIYYDNFLKECKKYSLDFKAKSFHYREPQFIYNEIPYKEQSIISGKFYSELYFKKYKNDILNLFSESVDSFPMFWNVKDNDIFVAVHIRTKECQRIPLKYYERCQEYLRETLEILGKSPGDKSLRFIYFTDDIEFVNQNFLINDTDLVLNLNDNETLKLSRKCHHFIIQVSSLSWWSGWLGSYENKIVLAPNKWSNNEMITLYPKEWIQIDCSPSSINSYFFMGILSCKKYESRRKTQDLKNCPFEYLYFIGDSDLTEPKEDTENKIVYLPCSDLYEHLPQKVYQMIDWIYKNKTNIKYMIKTDDDIIFNFPKLKMYSSYILNNRIDYAGKVQKKSNNSQSDYHYGKVEDLTLNKTKVKMPKCSFAEGGCYFLSKKSMDTIVNKFNESQMTIYEDQSIGHCLNQYKIFPFHIAVKHNACFWTND